MQLRTVTLMAVESHRKKIQAVFNSIKTQAESEMAFLGGSNSSLFFLRPVNQLG